ncbi:hypothetical protein Syun_022078 [Stephania yunnanensis]|uniref:Uncharacterized protein n=1 Tax=Stephania yunnanensis TaxID=152371 RepID=A0AAP0IGU9_9MAGN
MAKAWAVSFSGAMHVIDAKSDQYLEVKAMLSEVDDEKRSVTFTIIGGDLFKIVEAHNELH